MMLTSRNPHSGAEVRKVYELSFAERNYFCASHQLISIFFGLFNPPLLLCVAGDPAQI